MCVIETKTYHHASGRHEVIETPRRCRDAPRAGGLCRNIERRDTGGSRIIERRPLSGPSTAQDPSMIVTESNDGRQRVYRDLSRRASERSMTTRRSGTGSNRSSVEKTSKSPSPLSNQVPSSQIPPRAPTPPPVSKYPFPDPSYLPALPLSEPVTRPDGTAVYGLPANTFNYPRAAINERPSSLRRSSFSSTSAEFDETSEPSRRIRRTSKVTIDTNVRPPLNNNTSDSPTTTSSPGLSRLPTRLDSLRSKRSSRHDSANDLPLPDYTPRAGERSSRTSTSTRESGVRQPATPLRPILKPVTPATPTRDETEAENARLSRLERERYEDRDRRRSEAARIQASIRARQEEAECISTDTNESRDRHRREAEAALVGSPVVNETYESRVSSERAQMARERDAAEARQQQRERRDEADQRYADAQVKADETARRAYHEDVRRSRIPRLSAEASGSLRSPRPATRVQVHQGVMSSEDRGRGSGSLRERGEAVLAREQARPVGGEYWESPRRSRDSQGAYYDDGFEREWVEEYGVGDALRSRESYRVYRRDRERRGPRDGE